MSKIYQFNLGQRIWAHPDKSALSYSDGDESEEYLFSVITNAKDVSTTSPELASAIKDWPSEYHLSPVRHNLLRPFSIGSRHHILELGCGCGAMTRYLGETGATVVAVEGSRRRAMITAARCRDLPNVSVYCDNLIDFQTIETFDFVTLIGVLEYSNQFISGSDPVHDCLKKAGSFLANNGALVLAIENQLGLKYFNGCNEDHLGIPYFGINGLYHKDCPVTFGRHALTIKLNEANLPKHDFFYPFPDYKLPGLVLSEAALCDDQLNLADLLIHHTGHDYPETRHRAFSEDLAWRVVAKNRLVAEFANSFLVVARANCTNITPLQWLAKIYSRGRRRPGYQVETTIEPIADNKLIVQKSILNPIDPVVCKWLHHIVTDCNYIPGELLIVDIHRSMSLNLGTNDLASCFKPWLNFLQTCLIQNEQGEHLLPGNFVDCIPSNMIKTADGSLYYFDAEWVSATAIPMAWIVIRGITYSLIGCIENTAVNSMTYRQLIVAVTEYAGFHLSDTDFSTADNWERKLVLQCHIDATKTPSLAKLYDDPLFLMFRLSDAPALRHRLVGHILELERIKNTISWRITAPLRVVWNIYKKSFYWLKNNNL